MPLRLQIENFLTLENGEAISVAVPETGLTVGRGAGMGWVLPDASLHVSAHHFDALGHGETWILQDRSTNGTYLQGERQRLDHPHRLRHGDRFQVGPYIVVALIEGPADLPEPPPGWPGGPPLD